MDCVDYDTRGLQNITRDNILKKLHALGRARIWNTSKNPSHFVRQTVPTYHPTSTNHKKFIFDVPVRKKYFHNIPIITIAARCRPRA